MSFLEKLRGILFASPMEAGRNYWFYVKCDACCEVLKGRVDKYNDLSRRYPEGRGDFTLYTRKVMIGSQRCYKQIEVELTFGSNRKLKERQIKGGTFVTEEEYEEAHGA